MRDYELVYIINPQLVDDGLTGVMEKVSQFIATRGGQVDRVDTWGRRRLAYPIGSFREGTYVLTQFKMEPTQAAELETSLRTAEDIIRHLVIRLDEAQVKQRQQQLLQQQQREEQERLRREQAAAQAAAHAQEAAAQAAAAQEAATQAAAQAATKEAEAQAEPEQPASPTEEAPAAEAGEEPAQAEAKASEAGPETS